MNILMEILSILIVFWFFYNVCGYLFWSKMNRMDQAYENSKKNKKP